MLINNSPAIRNECLIASRVARPIESIRAKAYNAAFPTLHCELWLAVHTNIMLRVADYEYPSIDASTYKKELR